MSGKSDMIGSIDCVVMASGFARRFGANKLLHQLGGLPIVEHVLQALPRERLGQCVAVTRYREVAEMAAKYSCRAVLRPEETLRQSGTIRVGLQSIGADAAGCLFVVGDQPFLKKESILRLIDAFQADRSRIVALGYGGRRGNPVIFPRALFGELLTLPEEATGGHVIRAHSELLCVVEASGPNELRDIDTAEDLEIG